MLQNALFIHSNTHLGLGSLLDEACDLVLGLSDAITRLAIVVVRLHRGLGLHLTLRSLDALDEYLCTNRLNCSNHVVLALIVTLPLDRRSGSPHLKRVRS
jgi:hypothetical protein